MEKKVQKKKYFYIVRHGETDFNTDPVPRIRGRVTVPLNEQGVQHAKEAGEFLSHEKNIGKIYYSSIPRAKQTAEIIAEQQKTKPELVEEPLVIDITWGDWEGKTYLECFGREDGGDYTYHPDRLMIPNGETFYGVMDRMRKFLEKFWQSDEEVCTIVSHGAVLYLLGLIITQAPLEKWRTMGMNSCGVSGVKMKGINDFTIDFWNAHHFLTKGKKGV
jgi:probable phosphoglycerate mutase